MKHKYLHNSCNSCLLSQLKFMTSFLLGPRFFSYIINEGGSPRSHRCERRTRYASREPSLSELAREFIQIGDEALVLSGDAETSGGDSSDGKVTNRRLEFRPNSDCLGRKALARVDAPKARAISAPRKINRRLNGAEGPVRL